MSASEVPQKSGSSTPTISDTICALGALWYQLASLDHHKDRDCHWTIETVWSYGRPPSFLVTHSGYIFREVNEEASSYEAAEQLLLNTMLEAFGIEFASAWKKLNQPHECDPDICQRILALKPVFDKVIASHAKADDLSACRIQTTRAAQITPQSGV